MYITERELMLKAVKGKEKKTETSAALASVKLDYSVFRIVSVKIFQLKEIRCATTQVLNLRDGLLPDCVW